MRRTQIPLFAPETEWVAPHELKDLSGAKEVAIDLETYDHYGFLVEIQDQDNTAVFCDPCFDEKREKKWRE